MIVGRYIFRVGGGVSFGGKCIFYPSAINCRSTSNQVIGTIPSDQNKMLSDSKLVTNDCIHKFHTSILRGTVFEGIKERRFAKSVVKRLLKSHATVRASNPDVSGEALYKEILLHSQLVDPADINTILWEAEDSLDDWTASGTEAIDLRHVAHFIVMSRYMAENHSGTVTSLREIVYSLIPADL